MHRRVWFWRSLYPVLTRFCREHGVSFNTVVNRAVELFLGQVDVEELKLRAELDRLLREEAELRRACSAMLRSGSYLPSYVQRTCREPGRAVTLAREGQVPLKALNPDEERVFRKICTRREQIAGEIARIQEQLLKGVKPYRLAQDGWRSHHSRPPRRERRKPSRDEEEGEFAGVPSSDQNKCHKPVNNVRDKREGEL